MRYTIFISLSITAILIILNACDKSIDWDVKSTDARLVVEGSITDEYKKHVVRLTKTLDFNTNAEFVPVENAEVSISDGSKHFILIEKEDGFYETQDSMIGILGKTYSLNIELDKPIYEQTHYTAEAELKGYFTLDTVLCYLNHKETWEDDTSSTLILVLYGQEAPETGEDYYQYYLQHFNNKESLSITDKSIFSDLGENGMTEMAVFYFVDYDVNIGDEFSLEVRSVPEEYSTFKQELEMEIDRYDPIGMLGPPANVKGNIKNGAMGFFMASSVSRYQPVVVDEL